MKTSIQLSGVAIAAAMLIASAGNAVSAETTYASDYPGLKTRGGAIDIAESQVRAALEGFQLAFGRNPASWSEVTKKGIFDNVLLGYGMERINPDDASIDFTGDIYIESTAAEGDITDLRLYNSWNGSTEDVDGPLVTNKGSYADRFAEMMKEQDLNAGQQEIIREWLGNEAQLVQFAQIRQLGYAAIAFQDVNGHYPDSIQQLVKEGFGPLSSTTINPMTGKAYSFDGSRGEIKYSLMDGGKGFRITHVDLTHDVDFEFSY